MRTITRSITAAASLVAASLLGVIAPAARAQAAGNSGYLMVSADGRVHPFGSAPFCGHSDHVWGGGDKATDVEVTPNGQGYWVLAAHGYVDFKDCGMPNADWLDYEHNNSFDLQGGEDAVSMSVLPDGTGYWVFTNRGRALSFGNAQFFGDMSGTPLNGEVLGSVATPDGKGYWMVASDGGIFAFGNAKFYGSTGGIKLNKPVMSMAPDPDGVGYWLVASDGGIFAFNAAFKGSMGGTTLNRPVSGMVPGSDGYLMVAEDGGIFSFGNVAFHGSLGATPSSSPILAVSLFSDPIFGTGGTGGNTTPPPPPPPPPVYEWTEIVAATVDQGEYQSLPFTVQGTNVNVIHLCEANGGYTEVSCHFRLYHYPSGDWEDGWSLVAEDDSDARNRFISVEPGQYYVEVIPIDNDFLWGFSVMDNRCVQHCV